jgi:hypothetical protein
MTTATETAPAPSAGGKAPVFLMVALGAIFFDETGLLGSPNVRGSWEYDTAPNAKFKATTGDGKAGLYEDIEANGMTTPLWVDTLSPAESEFLHSKTGVRYDYVCLRGHRRGRVLKQLAAKYPGRFDSVPCQVYGGLAESERIQLKVDQIHVKGLSDWGIYLAIKALAFARLTEPQIATRIGMSRGFVQAKLRVARLPQMVEDEFLKKCKGEPAVNLTDKNLNALMMAQNADEAKGMRNEDGKGTPSFVAEWSQIVETGKQTNATPTAMNRKDLMTIIGMTKDPIIADVLRYAAGDPVQLPAIVNTLETLRTQALAYQSIMASDPASNPPAAPDATLAVNATPTPTDSAPTEETNATPTDSAPTDSATATPTPTGDANHATDATLAPFEPEPPADPNANVAGAVMEGWAQAAPAPAPAPALQTAGRGNRKSNRRPR